ncbi:MAG: ABC transporter ATP-binding protein [Clostridia bacterium]|nr:ABC transporter ATP-binding protein [Clostridia bacterium]
MLKRLLKCTKGYKTQTILTPIFMLGEVIFELLIPYLMSTYILSYLDEINRTGASPDFTYLLISGGILVLCACFSFTFGSLSAIFCAKATAGFGSNLRKELFYKVQSFSFKNIDKFSTSSLVTRLTTDVTNVQHAFMMIIRTAVRSPLMLIFSLIFSIKMYSQVGNLFFIIVPILVLGLGTIMIIAIPYFNKIFKRYDALNESVQENVKGMRVVKAYVREDYEKEKFEKASNEVRKNFTKAESILAFNNPIMMLCMYGMILCIIFICGRAGIIDNDLQVVANLQTLISYSSSVLMALMMLSMIFVMITMTIASAKRIDEVLVEEIDIVNPENAILEIKNGDIDFENVYFSYNGDIEKSVLTNVDLHISSGETIGIIGATGSSKTTIANLISRLYDVTSGSVKVAGVDVRNYDIEALRNEVSVVLQKNLLFSGTIADNIRWGDENASLEEVQRVCKLAVADEFIETFPDKYDTHIEQGGTNVSGGQKQRLCIARALLKKPKILILDDSTSAVDTKTDAKIRHALKTEVPYTTKIIIAQRIASVKDADRIIVLDNGKISAMGVHEELLKTSNIYKEVYDTQFRPDEEGGEE